MDLLVDNAWLAEHVQIREQMHQTHLVYVLSRFNSVVFVRCN